MKTKILTLISALILTLGFASCGDNWNPSPDKSGKKGQLSLASMSVDVNHVENEVSRAGVDVSNFIVKIYNESGALAEQFKYGQMPEIITLPVGDYTVKVISHQIAKAAWDEPYYEGQKTFTISDNTITEIGTITCKFASLKVSIRFTQDLINHLTDEANVEVIANDEGSLTFATTETRSGYYEVIANSTTLVATFRGTLDGSYIEYSQSFTDIVPGQHRIITYDVSMPGPSKPEQTGYIDPITGLSLDISVVDKDITGGIDNSEDIIEGPEFPKEDPENPSTQDPDPNPDPDPDPNPDPQPANTITVTSETLKFYTDADPQTNNTEVSPATVKVHSDDGIAHFYVKIGSTDPNFVMAVGEVLATEFDLANPVVTRDGQQVDLGDDLSDTFGFPVRNDVIGKNDMVLDISAFVPLLAGFPGSTHSFTLTITDSKGVTLSKVLKFKVD